MNRDDLDRAMRDLEYFHDLRVLPGALPVVRVDGRSFSRLTEERFEKPFDVKFQAHMRAASEALLVGLGALYAYTESDEISILLPADTELFDRKWEKLVSVAAGIASAAFSVALGEPAHFDARIWIGVSLEQVADYFRWRQADAARNALNGWTYWTLRKEGHSVREATAALDGRTTAWKNELLFSHGINFNELPLWQRRGTGLYFKTRLKQGRNPQTGEIVSTERRAVHVDEELSIGDEYGAFVRSFVEPA